MLRIIRTIRGSNPSREPLRRRARADIFAPRRDLTHRVWSCRIRCPALFDGPKYSAGVDAAQAEELAELIVRTVMEGRGYRILE